MPFSLAHSKSGLVLMYAIGFILLVSALLVPNYLRSAFGFTEKLVNGVALALLSSGSMILVALQSGMSSVERRVINVMLGVLFIGGIFMIFFS